MTTTPLRFAAKTNLRVLPEWTAPDSRFEYIDIGSVGSDGSIRRPTEMIAFADAPSRARRLAPPGSTIVSTVRTYLRAIAYVDADLAGNAVFSTGFAVLEPAPWLNDRFFHYACRSEPFVDEVVARSVGVSYPAIAPTDLGSLEIPSPSLAVQQRIADFLDDQVARIDEIVHLRAEQSSALEASLDAQIFAAISGIDESCEKRASGLPWLGPIPDHWKVATVGSQFSVMLGKMLNEERARGTSLRPYLRNVNVQWDQIDVTDLAEMNFPPSERRRYEVLPGDLLICEGGQPGRAAIWRGEVGEIYYQKALHRARPRQDYADVRWLFYLLRAAVTMDVFAAQGNQATIAHLTGEQLRAQRFPFPSLSEQASLIARLDAAAEKIEAAKGEMHAQIDLLKERKRSLITAAVTGEFDVSTASGRGVA